MNRFLCHITRLIVCVAVLCTLSSFAAREDTTLYKEGYSLILQEKWGEAEKAFAEFSKRHPDSSWVDDAAFWTCFARDKGKLAPAEAFECYGDFLKKWPASEWADDARRHLVMLSKQLARGGKPEYLTRAESLIEDAQEHESPEDEILAMLSSLGELGDERSRKAVMQYFDKTKDDSMRAEIVMLFNEMHDPAITAKLIDILQKDPSMEVRANAAEALADRDDKQAREALVAAARSAGVPAELRIEILKHLAGKPFSGMVPLLEELIGAEKNVEVTREVMEILAELEDEGATKALFKIYSDSNQPQIKEAVIAALGDSENSEGLAFLTKIATGGNQELAGMAISAIENFDRDKALPALTHISSADIDWRTRAAAIYVLGDLETPESVPLLQELLGSFKEAALRKATVEALGKTNHRDAVALLADVIRNEADPGVKRDAIEALGDMDIPEAREALLRILEEKLGKE